MRKFLSVILSLGLILSLAACGGAEAPQAGGGSGNAVENGGGAAEAEIFLTGEISGEITISAYNTMQSKTFLEDAARLFEEKHPGAAVNVETFSAMPEIKSDGQGNIIASTQDDSQSWADYINKVNTSLMSGNGADIYLMDVLPVHKYADSGQLENLDAYMEADPDFDRADYPGNILDAIRYKGGTWFLPMDYTFNYYAYDATLIPGATGFGTGGAFTAGQLIELAENSFDGAAMMFNAPDYNKRSGGMWGNLLEENYTCFVNLENNTANFDDGSFAALLESVKQYSERRYIPKGAAGRADAGAMMQRAGEGATGRVFFNRKNAVNLIALFTRDSGMKMTAMAEGNTMAIGDDDEIAGIAADADGSITFTYEQAYGINANSPNKVAAWAFLKFLLSEEMQISANLRPAALPVSNSAREKKMEIMLTGMMEQQGQSLTEKHLEAIKEYNDAVNQLSGQIDAYVLKDTVIDDMIASEVAYFFDGTKTAVAVASTLQNKVALYLNE